jgi:hypothetical protein
MDAEPADHYKLNAHDISAALESLDGRSSASPDEMAQLEIDRRCGRSQRRSERKSRQKASGPIRRVVDGAPGRLAGSDGCLQGSNGKTRIDRAADRISNLEPLRSLNR